MIQDPSNITCSTEDWENDPEALPVPMPSMHLLRSLPSGDLAAASHGDFSSSASDQMRHIFDVIQPTVLAFSLSASLYNKAIHLHIIASMYVHVQS